MLNRTFFRILFDNLFINNPVSKAVITLVNFCNNSYCFNSRKLKFSENMPLHKKEDVINYKNRFIFDSSNICGVNSK